MSTELIQNLVHGREKVSAGLVFQIKSVLSLCHEDKEDFSIWCISKFSSLSLTTSFWKTQCELDERAVMGTENWLQSRAQRIMITRSGWKTIINGVPRVYCWAQYYLTVSVYGSWRTWMGFGG